EDLVERLVERESPLERIRALDLREGERPGIDSGEEPRVVRAIARRGHEERVSFGVEDERKIRLEPWNDLVKTRISTLEFDDLLETIRARLDDGDGSWRDPTVGRASRDLDEKVPVEDRQASGLDRAIADAGPAEIDRGKLGARREVEFCDAAVPFR